MADSLPVTCSMEPGVQRASPEGFSLADIAIEIRHMIYDAINEPRMVEIHYNGTLSSVWSPTKVPMGLHICKESREEAKRHYHYGFCGTDNMARIWFDFRCDSMYFSTSPFLLIPNTDLPLPLLISCLHHFTFILIILSLYLRLLFVFVLSFLSFHLSSLPLLAGSEMPCLWLFNTILTSHQARIA
jgi:hypothetical protein